MLFVGENVLLRAPARPGVSALDIGIEIGLIAAAVVFADARVPLGLARQQVNFLEVAPFFVRLQYQLAIACGGGDLHLIERAVIVPLVAAFPTVYRDGILPDHFCDASDAKPLPIQVHGLTAGI